MGSLTSAESRAFNKKATEAARSRAEAKEKRQVDLAGKIAMVVIDMVNRDIIRPGPDPEERECYDMSQELRDIGPSLQTRIAEVIAAEGAKSDETP